MSTSKATSKKRAFCPLDYEHVSVVPTPDGLNNARVQVTKRYKLRSVREWIEVACEEMKDEFRILKTWTTQPEKAQLALDSYRAALESSFDEAAYKLEMPAEQRSRRDKNGESSDEENEKQDSEHASEEEGDSS